MDERAWTIEELAAYRAEVARRAAPDYTPKRRGKSGRRLTAFQRAYFVAWDGEGETDPDGLTHRYTLLAAGWYDDAGAWHTEAIRAAPGERLSTRACFELFERVSERVHKQAIHVGYALTYDITHILYDLDRATAIDVLAPSRQHWGWWGEYGVKVLPRHELRIQRRGRSKWSFTLWDVYGFFQSSFVTALEKWIGPDAPGLDVIRRGKEQRGGTIDDVEAYNEAELKALVALMRALHGALSEAGLTLSRWDGAGAAAVAAIHKYLPPALTRLYGAPTKAKDFFERAHWLQEREADLYHALQSAYFGGRIEALRFGTRRGRLYHADINSAYPAAMVTLPDLARGTWEYRAAPDIDALPTFSVVHVAWRAPVGLRWHPFPFRDRDGSIYYPRAGVGWYWYNEARAAWDGVHGDTARFGAAWDWSAIELELIGAWVFYPDDPDARPFDWIRELYALRQRLIRSGEGEGAQKAIKLAINSLYGKLAQHAGARGVEQTIVNPVTGRSRTIRYERAAIPPFYNIAAAGYITAHCRAALMRAALSRPNAVLSFATDGIYSTAPLAIERSGTKELGKWEEKVYSDCTYVGVQPGIYYVHDHTRDRWFEMSRGFPHARGMDRQAAIAARVERIWAGWRARESSIYIEGRRMVTLRAAAASEGQWALRGCWVPIVDPHTGAEGRELVIWDGSHKRRVGLLRSESERRRCDPRARTPADTMLRTYPHEPPALARALAVAELGGPLPASTPHTGVPRRAYIEELEHLEDELDAYLEHA